MFLCLHNTLCSVLYLLEVFPNIRASARSGGEGAKKFVTDRLGTGAAVLIVLTALVAVASDLDMTVGLCKAFYSSRPGCRQSGVRLIQFFIH